jgi:hypothetical protein
VDGKRRGVADFADLLLLIGEERSWRWPRIERRGVADLLLLLNVKQRKSYRCACSKEWYFCS